MLRSNKTTEEWQALDAAHHVHPFCDHKSLKENGVKVIVKGEGSHLWDSDGNKILDGMAGLWCVNVGYGRKDLTEVAARQMDELPYYNTFFQCSSPPQIELANKLSEVTPEHINHFFYANSGSEANDSIIKFIRLYWDQKGKPEKRTIIGRNLGYHGSTIAATSLSGMGAMKKLGGNYLPEFEHILEPHYYMHGNGMTEEEFGLYAANQLEEKILEIGADKVGAFFGEPVQGAGGVIDPPANYWPRIQEICTKYNILLVCDEVICGFGRLGTWFGQNFYGIKPDIMTMAKGLSSGYMPISAIGFSDDVYEALHYSGVLANGYTYSGHPVSCAVALKNIQILQDEKIIDRVASEAVPAFREGLKSLSKNHSIIGEVRGQGLLAGIQLMKNAADKVQFEVEEQAANICRDIAIKHGLIMRAVDRTMVVCPPLVITPSEITEFLEKADAALTETEAYFGLR
ncbi:aspartate aminotransferase family protein [Hirschia baltica]|uniref:Aminotransferase class-III n=1 Tax=Hirschia baltica (strain ATCC 49814 / DSM 5838 / IFAM 1418) TaxID=582402 RepID=C6XP14_HIRBI|nr:aspartate aminotransferase family protein [Hirschia baltica]ACT60194.1 aminotransferase class-III [Hirschia baltica ATCC 49814]